MPTVCWPFAVVDDAENNTINMLKSIIFEFRIVNICKAPRLYLYLYHLKTMNQVIYFILANKSLRYLIDLLDIEQLCLASSS